MPLSSKILVIIVLLTCVPAIADDDFKSERCYSSMSRSTAGDDSWFSIEFQATDGRVRRVTIAAIDHSLKFKGTTLEDFKWVADYERLKNLEIDSDSQLWIHFIDGRSKPIGTVEPQCLEDLRAYNTDGLEIVFANQTGGN